MITLEPLDPRVPSWDLSRTAERACPFCGQRREPALLRPDRLPVAFCAPCDCWHVCALPSPEEIRAFYEQYWGGYRPADFSEASAREMQRAAPLAARANWPLQRLSVLLGGLQGKRLIEAGFGRGTFLLMARALGADVAGCDISPKACRFARKRLGLSVFESSLGGMARQDASADAVAMNDFIEHSADPLADLRAACTLLKPGGLLLIRTPNGGAAGQDADSARRWTGFRVDYDHLQYLSSRTIHHLGAAAGWRIEHLETYGFPSPRGANAPRERF
ncbi:MAG: class I SAM-dependent methyltransferase, partial [Candidatus Sumerlaeota bacterium]|nr:class I SAM-dependent methyltransferase [Candidatus Sumerlaeota bacterium]